MLIALAVAVGVALIAALFAWFAYCRREKSAAAGSPPPTDPTAPKKDDKEKKAEKPGLSAFWKFAIMFIIVSAMAPVIGWGLYPFFKDKVDPTNPKSTKIVLKVTERGAVQHTLYKGEMYRNDDEVLEFVMHYNHDLLGYMTRYVWLKKAANVGTYSQANPPETGTFTWRESAFGKGWIAETTVLTGDHRAKPATIEVTVDPEGLR